MKKISLKEEVESKKKEKDFAYFGAENLKIKWEEIKK